MRTTRTLRTLRTPRTLRTTQTRLGSIPTDMQIEVDSLSPINKKIVLNSIVDSFSNIGIAQYEEDVVNLLEMMHYFSQQSYIGISKGFKYNQNRSKFRTGVNEDNINATRKLQEYVKRVFPQMLLISQLDTNHKLFFIKKGDTAHRFELNINTTSIAKGQY